jgi:phage terminase large subunit
MKLKEYDVCYTASSRNIAEERSRYVWLKDPKTGKSINEPIGTFDHTLAAVRYAVYTHFYRSK